jgi:hypothetical protein
MAFPLGVASLILGYALLYTAVINLQNGGQGPGLFENLGINIGGFSSNPGLGLGQSAGDILKKVPVTGGQPPSSNTSPGVINV